MGKKSYFGNIRSPLENKNIVKLKLPAKMDKNQQTIFILEKYIEEELKQREKDAEVKNLKDKKILT